MRPPPSAAGPGDTRTDTSDDASDDTLDAAGGADAAAVKQPRLWRDNGWTARVIKNEDDDGWAVEMVPDGQSEPALVGPWTMGRDKKNPKPLDAGAFLTLVKTASEVIRRHEQHLHAMHHQAFEVEAAGGRVRVTLDTVPDEDQPHAVLAAHDADGGLIASHRLPAGRRLTARWARDWVEGGCQRP